ncbi:MAG: hypothetical protein U0736_27600, partial [Gemmataceae bacterium]
LGRDPGWLGGKFGGWLEGNAVVTPAGDVVDILRVDFPGTPEKAAIVRVSKDGKKATFDPVADFVDFPGGGKKFTIRYDPVSRAYWALVNQVLDEYRNTRSPSVRNTVALGRSTDLRTWEVRAVILRHPDVKKHAFQYLDWLIDGDDLLVLSRTAYDDGQGGAHNAHDANYLTFHRVRGFRTAR